MDTRDTNDHAEKPRRRGGLLRQMMERQEDVKGYIQHLRDASDKTMEEGLAGQLGYDDDTITAVVLTAKEMSSEPESMVTTIDLIWASEWLDHLDTQGYQIRRKKEKKGGRRKK
jgi:hypothetical protein